MTAVPARDLDELYTVPPGEFVRTRNALVAKLREAGHAAKAAEIRRLRKPTPAVWVINRLAREHPRPLATFIDAVDDLKRAHMRAPGELAQATERQREALNELLERARGLLTASGLRPSLDMLGRVSATLLGAAAEPKARRELQQGRLVQELQAPGFEVFAGAPPPPRRPSTQRAERQSRGLAREANGRSARLKKDLRVATGEVQDFERRAVDLDRAAAKHRKAADKAAHTAEQLAEQLRQAHGAAHRARRAAEDAERGAQHARDEAKRAQARARDTERELNLLRPRALPRR